MSALGSRLIYCVAYVSLLGGCFAPNRKSEGPENPELKSVVKRDAKIIPPDPAPKYPKIANREKVSGVVIVTFRVGTYGAATDVKVLKEEPPDYGFAKSVLDQVSALRFDPAIKNGKKVEQQIKRIYTFDNDAPYSDSIKGRGSSGR